MDLSQDFTCYPKRERFVFRPNHIEVLERCFQEDSYPTYEKREEIARTCNTATEAMGEWQSSVFVLCISQFSCVLVVFSYNSSAMFQIILLSLVTVFQLGESWQIRKRWPFKSSQTGLQTNEKKWRKLLEKVSDTQYRHFGTSDAWCWKTFWKLVVDDKDQNF